MKNQFLIIFILILVGCQSSEESAEDIFGVKTSPEVIVHLMKISPANKTLFKGESVQLSASGGTSPYAYTIDSGIGTVTTSGLYTAPNVIGNSVVKAIDFEGEIAYATINIANQISISPTSATLNEGETVQLTGSGGVPIYSYRIVTGSGSIDSSTGLYDSTGVGSGSAVVEVKDSVGNNAYSAIAINPSLAISPQLQTIGFSEQISFSSSGGSTPYTYSILSGSGTIGASTGVYISGTINDTVVVRVTDNISNIVDATITIVDSPQIIAPQSLVSIGRSVTFTASNGTPPYTYSIVSGGGSIVGATGVFSAAPTIDSTIIKVTDSNNNTDSVSITSFIPKQITSSLYHTCQTSFESATTSTSKCWGNFGLTTDQGSAIGPYPGFLLGDDPVELGDNLLAVDLGTGVTIRGVKIGRYSACAITTDDRLKCWGYNGNGQLGIGSSIPRGQSLFNMGDNLSYMDLGTGLKINSVLPADDVLDIFDQSVCAILDNDELKCWGYNGTGELGLGVSGGANTSISNVASETGDGLNAVDLGADKAIQVGIGEKHACVLLDNQKVKCWGDGTFGQTGRENLTPNITGNTTATKPVNLPYIDLGTGRTASRICAGYSHSCAILDTGDVKCWGLNAHGQLGQGHINHLGDDASEMGDNLLDINIGTSRTATDLVCSGYSTCVTLDTGDVKCWGYNAYGNLGIGNTTYIGDNTQEMGDSLEKVNLGISRTAVKLFKGIHQVCAKLDNGDMKCWGKNGKGQLGQGHLYNIGQSALSLGDNLDPINLSSTESIVAIQANEFSACGLLSDNTLKCYGGEHSGSRGSGLSIIGDKSSEMGANLLTLDTGTNATFKKIKSKDLTTCGLNFDNQLSCWSDGASGARASGNSVSRGGIPSDWGDGLEFIDFGGGRTVKDFDIAYRSGCAILSDDSVACWGRNYYGQVGLQGFSVRGDSASEVGNHFVTNPTNLGTVSTPTEIVAGYQFKCARFSNGKIKCWGRNEYGQLGKVEATYPLLGTLNAHMGDNLTFLDLGTNINSTQICAGREFACSLFDNQKVKCWGRGTYGQLGQGSNTDLGDHAGELGDVLNFINLGTNRTAKKISCGQQHACAILDNDSLKCWGYNQYGQLGQGDILHRGDQSGEMGDNLQTVNLGTGRFAIDIIGGYHSTCAVLDNNDVKCWGQNNNGQLGLGHLTEM